MIFLTVQSIQALKSALKKVYMCVKYPSSNYITIKRSIVLYILYYYLGRINRLNKLFIFSSMFY